MVSLFCPHSARVDVSLFWVSSCAGSDRVGECALPRRPEPEKVRDIRPFSPTRVRVPPELFSTCSPAMDSALQAALEQSGLTPSEIGECAKRLSDPKIRTAVELISRLASGDVEFGDVGVPRAKRGALKQHLEPRLPFSTWEIHVARDLCELSSWKAKDDCQCRQDFVAAQKPRLLQHAECTVTFRRYVLAIFAREGVNVQFVAFSGHLGDNDLAHGVAACVEHRLQHTKFAAILRLAQVHGCSHLLFCGHSVGGAVSHLSALAVRQMVGGTDADMTIKSIAFAAPNCCLSPRAALIETARCYFLNFCDDADLVPHLYRVAKRVSESRALHEVIVEIAKTELDVLHEVIVEIAKAGGRVSGALPASVLNKIHNIVKRLMEVHDADATSETLVGLHVCVGGAQCRILSTSTSFEDFIADASGSFSGGEHVHTLSHFEMALAKPSTSELLRKRCTMVHRSLGGPPIGEMQMSVERILCVHNTALSMRTFLVFGANMDFCSSDSLQVSSHKETSDDMQEVDQTLQDLSSCTIIVRHVYRDQRRNFTKCHLQEWRGRRTVLWFSCGQTTLTLVMLASVCVR